MSLTRRQFLIKGSVAGGALSLGFSLTGCSPVQLPKFDAADFQPDSHLRFTPDGEVIMQIVKAEMGQGVITGLTTILAEELGIDPTAIKTEFAPPHKAFADPEFTFMITGGSTSIRVYYPVLREVGAAARAMLLQAGSQLSGTPVAELDVTASGVTRLDGSGVLPFAELLPVANTLSVPESVQLKPESEFKFIGRFDQRLDNQGKVDGSAVFGLDPQLPNTAYAVVLRCPMHGGGCAGWNADLALQEPGVIDIFQINSGIAVVAKNTWRARKAAEKVEVNWTAGESSLQSSESIDQALTAALDGEDFKTMRDDGEAPAAGVGRVIEAQYDAPFLAHAAMEPLNATVHVRNGEADIWVGTQAPDIAQIAAARQLDLPVESVRLHNTFLGGGFGRRAVFDNVVEAAEIGQRLQQPVKLVWSREDDTRHDFYRPVHKSRFSATVADDGRVLAWKHNIASPSINATMMPLMAGSAMPDWVPHAVPEAVGAFMEPSDHSSVEGSFELPYQFDAIEVGYKAVPTPLPLGFWRSVGHSQNAFVVESFIDEVAAAAGEDPVSFRRRWLPEESRQRAVLDRVAEISNWGQTPANRYRGVAVHESFHSVVAEVVEVSFDNGQLKLEKVWCAVDCGRAVNPDIVRAQMEGGILFGFTAALKSRITIAEGAVQQSNFHDYPMLRMNETPEIEVSILELETPPTGVGEPGTPPAAPALANAIFAATGKRMRSMPFDLS